MLFLPVRLVEAYQIVGSLDAEPLGMEREKLEGGNVLAPTPIHAQWQDEKPGRRLITEPAAVRIAWFLSRKVQRSFHQRKPPNQKAYALIRMSTPAGMFKLERESTVWGVGSEM